MNNRKYWIAFSSIEEISSVFVKKLYDKFGSIERAFNVSYSELVQTDGITPKKAEQFLKIRDKINFEKIEEQVKDFDLITYEDENYPKLLKEIYNPPMFLYTKGDLTSCNLNKTLAVVGSRRASRDGKNALTKILSEFQNTDICIVSGLAEGIDAVAHKTALDNNIKTIGIIGSGFNFVYPTTNKELYKRIEDGGGAILTEFFPTFEPIKFRFPQRNRIVSGMSYGTLVAEAALKSGALITASLTLEQGRELMCMPGLISNPNTEGIYKLLKSGATLVTSADDILNTLNWEIKKETSATVTNDSNLDEEKILYTISIESKCFDEIQSETGLDTDKLLNTLTMLELKGKIRQVYSDRYEKV